MELPSTPLRGWLGPAPSRSTGINVYVANTTGNSVSRFTLDGTLVGKLKTSI